MSDATRSPLPPRKMRERRIWSKLIAASVSSCDDSSSVSSSDDSDHHVREQGQSRRSGLNPVTVGFMVSVAKEIVRT